MGNCMQSCKNGKKEEEIMIEEKEQEEEASRSGSSSEEKLVKKESAFEKSSLKVKIVLTKQELQWLMLQLKDNQGKGLEACLGEIGKGIIINNNNNNNNKNMKKKVGAWKPALESIMEFPEALEMVR